VAPVFSSEIRKLHSFPMDTPPVESTFLATTERLGTKALRLQRPADRFFEYGDTMIQLATADCCIVDFNMAGEHPGMEYEKCWPSALGKAFL